MGLSKYLFIDEASLASQGHPLPAVIPSLLRLQETGYLPVWVGRPGPETLVSLLIGQGVSFEAFLLCSHDARENCLCARPHLGLVRDYLKGDRMDFDRSAVVGRGEVDALFAQNLGIRFLNLDTHDWREVSTSLKSAPRCGAARRKTRETQVDVAVNLDDSSTGGIRTGIGYFDHMLEQVSKHGGFRLDVAVEGDLEVDEHHTVEDTALVLGEALRKALGDKMGIARFGFLLPMDEAEAKVALDLSARPYLVFKGAIPREKVGELPTELVPHFFRSLCDTLGATLHIEVTGENAHHMVEACFKGFGRALRMAIDSSGRSELPSTKGAL